MGRTKKALFGWMMGLMSLTWLPASAQSDLVLPLLRYVPQRDRINPAYVNDSRLFLGLPLLSSNNINLSMPFAYSDLFVKGDDDSLHMDFAGLADQLGKGNLVALNADLDLLAFNFRIRRTWVSFNATERIMARANLPGDLLRFAANGNGAFIGQTIDASDLNFDATHLREYAVGVATQFAEGKVTVGVRLKYLYGMENISTENRGISLYTDPEFFDLTAKADFSVNSSGFFGDGGFGSIGSDVSRYLFSRNNHGFAADLGVSARIKDKWTVSASLTDLGTVNWNENPTNHMMDGKDFTFRGVDLGSLFAQGDSTDKLVGVLDSLTSTFGLVERDKDYTTWLPTRFNIAGSYDIDAKSLVQLTFQGEVFKGQFEPTVAVGINRQFGKVFGLGLTYAYRNRSWANVGLGFALTVGPVQWYMAVDNIIGAIVPQHANVAHFHGGLSFVIGAGQGPRMPKNRDKDSDKDGITDQHDPCPDKPGPTETKGCPDTDMDGVPDHLDHCIFEPGLSEHEGCPEAH